MEAEIERYAQSTWNIPLGNPFKKAEAENLLNIGLVRPCPFKKAEAEGPWSISFKMQKIQRKRVLNGNS